MRFLTISFITTALYGVLKIKIDIEIKYFSLHILALTIKFECPERC